MRRVFSVTLTLLVALVTVVLGNRRTGFARGEEAAAPIGPAAPKSSDRDPGAGKSPLVFKGRIFSRLAFEKIDGGASDGSLDLSVPSARLGFRYKATDVLFIETEVDLSSSPILKDAIIEGKWTWVSVTAGQFKVPISSIEMESPWKLPMARRGLLHDLLVDQMQIAGRRPGVAAEVYIGRGVLSPRLTVGAFQASYWDPKGSFKFAKEASLHNQSLAARLRLGSKRLEVGLNGELRSFLSDGMKAYNRFWTAGGDVTLDLSVWGYGLRAWVEGLAGSTWMDAKLWDDTFSTFLSARAIVALRIGGGTKGDGYVEPFATFGVLDPDRSVDRDVITEAVVGLNVGHWRRLRLTLQGEWIRVGINKPGYLAGEGRGPVAADATNVVMQVGAAF